MKYFVAILILLSLAFAHATARPEIQDHVSKKLFAGFMRKYGKSYESNEEFQTRFQNFKNTMARVHLRNAEVGSNTYGITKFADMSPQEFRSQYLMNTPFPYTPDNQKDVIKVPRAGALPTTLDWRQKGAVTPVKNQKQCGSCWAFSVTENIESMWILAGKATNETVDLAPQQIVDCDTSDDGCNGGNPPTAYEYVIKAGGLESEKDYPYVAKDTKCTFDKSDVAATISSWKYATTDKNEQTMQENLYSVGPLSICVDAASWQDYNGGVVKSGCGHTLDHCVELVGYDTTNSKEPYWIVRNSWGTDWGYSGYIYVLMGQNMCGIAQEVTTAQI